MRVIGLAVSGIEHEATRSSEGVLQEGAAVIGVGAQCPTNGKPRPRLYLHLSMIGGCV